MPLAIYATMFFCGVLLTVLNYSNKAEATMTIELGAPSASEYTHLGHGLTNMFAMSANAQ